MGKSRAPEPPDPQETSAAQTATNIGTAIANNMMNAPNQTDPYGSITSRQTGTYRYRDPNSGEVHNIPLMQTNRTLSDNQQAIFDQNEAAQFNLASLANNQSDFLNEYMAEPFSYDVGDHEAWAGGLYDNLNSDSNAQAMETLNAQLANRGINIGSEAYDREIANMRESQQNSRDRFMLDSYGQGFNTAMATRNQPINEITALMSGSQVSMPGLVPTSSTQIPTTDVAGNINQSYNQRLAGWQQNQNNRSQLAGGLFGLASGGLAGGYF